MASGALLLYPNTEAKYLKKIGLIHGKNCYLLDMKNIANDISYVLDANNREKIDNIRRNGQEFGKNTLNSVNKYKTIKRNMETTFLRKT